MGMTTLERAVLAGAKLAFNNPKLRMKDIQKWSTNVKPHDGEVVALVADLGVSVAIKAENDKRKR